MGSKYNTIFRLKLKIIKKYKSKYISLHYAINLLLSSIKYHFYNKQWKGLIYLIKI
jgi:hypothetical protein